MAWSGEHPEAVKKIDHLMDGSPTLDTPQGFVDDVLNEIDDSDWEALERYADKNNPHPDYDAGIANEARSIVDVTIRSNGYTTESIEELFDIYDQMDETQEGICKGLIGMVVLKDGDSGPDDKVRQLKKLLTNITD